MPPPTRFNVKTETVHRVRTATTSNARSMIQCMESTPRNVPLEAIIGVQGLVRATVDEIALKALTSVEKEVDINTLDFELDKPAIQESGTFQCWWLSILEVIRLNGFMPKVLDYIISRSQNIVDSISGLEAYGPRWQRVVMNYLSNNHWHRYDKPRPGLRVGPTRYGPEFDRLRTLLGLDGIMLDDKFQDLYPATSKTTFDGAKKVSTESHEQMTYVVDKKAHAMVGMIMTLPEQESAKFLIYNQAKGSEGPIETKIGDNGGYQTHDGKDLNFAQKIYFRK